MALVMVNYTGVDDVSVIAIIGVGYRFMHRAFSPKLIFYLNHCDKCGMQNSWKIVWLRCYKALHARQGLVALLVLTELD